VTKSLSSKVIRGGKVSGVIFCSPGGELDTQNMVEEQDKQNLQALEDFWRNKGFQEGQTKGFEEGFHNGEEEGLRKGIQEGKAEGNREGYEAGLAEGKKQGTEEVTDRFTDSIQLVTQVSEKLSKEKDELLGKLKPEVLKFSIAVCESVLRCELTNPQVLTRLVEMLLTSAREIIREEVVTIVLSPEDYSMLEERFSDIDHEQFHVERVNFVSDPSVPRGDVRVETPMGLVNSNLQRQLEDLQTKVLEVREEVQEDKLEEESPAAIQETEAQ
jgi:flagellar assembly protein FliH